MAMCFERLVTHTYDFDSFLSNCAQFAWKEASKSWKPIHFITNRLALLTELSKEIKYLQLIKSNGWSNFPFVLISLEILETLCTRKSARCFSDWCEWNAITPGYTIQQSNEEMKEISIGQTYAIPLNVLAHTYAFKWLFSEVLKCEKRIRTKKQTN